MSSTNQYTNPASVPSAFAPNPYTSGVYSGADNVTNQGGAGGVIQGLGLGPQSSQTAQAATDYNQGLGQNSAQLATLMDGGAAGQALAGQQTGALGLLGNYANGGAASDAQQYAANQMAQSNQNIASSALSNQGGQAPGLTQRNMLMAQGNANAQIGSGAVQAGLNARGQAIGNNANAINQAYNTALNVNSQNFGITNQQGQNLGNAYAATSNQIANGSPIGMATAILGNGAKAASGAATSLGGTSTSTGGAAADGGSAAGGTSGSIADETAA